MKEALDVHIYTDSSAALGIVKRSGMGRLKHVQLQELWCQEVAENGRVKFHKICTKFNPADVLTKAVSWVAMARAMTFLRVQARSGRPKAAPALTSAINAVTFLVPYRG